MPFVLLWISVYSGLYSIQIDEKKPVLLVRLSHGWLNCGQCGVNMNTVVHNHTHFSALINVILLLFFDRL